MSDEMERWGDESISYLIAMYNQERFVGDCLSSLLAQTSRRWTALVLDDCSRDDSVAVVEAYSDPRIRLIRADRNRGYIAALKRLIREAPTDLMAILDPDDALHPLATAELVKQFREPEIGFVFSLVDVFDGDWSRFVMRSARAVPPGGSALLDGSIQHIRAFRRSVYDWTEGFDEEMLYAEDRDFIYKMEEVTRIGFVDRALYRYRRLAASQSHDPSKKEIGARNHLRAQFRALRRRRIRGLAWLAHAMHFLERYVAYSDRMQPLRRLCGRRLRKMSLWAQRRWLARTGRG